MGGCRCTFFRCESSTITNPTSHFFHFPIRDRSRCVQWAIYANRMDFLQLPIPKLKNKVVCDSHFRIEMFMNHKKERLIRTATPTLLTKGQEVIDLELKPTYVDYVGKNREIDVLAFLNNSIENSALEDTNKIDLDESSGPNLTTLIVTDDSDMEPPLKRVRTVRTHNKVNIIEDYTIQAVEEKPQPKVLNKFPMKNARAFGLDKVPAVKCYGSSVEEYIEEESFELVGSSCEIILPKKKVVVNPVAKTVKSIKSPTVIKREMEASSADSDKLEFLRIEMENMKSTMFHLQKKPTQCSEMEVKIKTNPVLKMSPLIKKDKPTTQQSKIQLFNGVKRYLSPPMTALLRIELFGNAECDWKVDEKRVATDLFHLGPDVYDFMRDEWRIRLPPATKAQAWSEELTEIAEDENVSD